MDSPKNESRSKAVLNVTVFKDAGDFSYPTTAYIPIDDLLEKNGVESINNINGVSCGDGTDSVTYTRFVVGENEIENLGHEIEDIIDAAIVNEKQSKAIKKLISEKCLNWREKHWEQIRNGDIM